MKFIKYNLLILCLPLLLACNSTNIKHAQPDFVFLEANHSSTAVILCHGRGKHPTWQVVDPLRKAIHQQLNMHTLSLQMPADDIPWQDYQYLFPEAYRRIQYSIDWLRTHKNVERIYLLGHSMGSRMGSGFIAAYPHTGITGFVGIGMRNNGPHPLDAKRNLTGITVPVLDLFGDGGNKKDWQHAKERKTLVSDNYRQVKITNANHRFTKHQYEMEQAVISWLKNTEKSN